MTVQQRFEIMLTANGFTDANAGQVMEEAKSRLSGMWPDHGIDFEARHETRPEIFYAAGFVLLLKKAALDWFDQNWPLSPFRVLFA